MSCCSQKDYHDEYRAERKMIIRMFVCGFLIEIDRTDFLVVRYTPKACISKFGVSDISIYRHFNSQTWELSSINLAGDCRGSHRHLD